MVCKGQYLLLRATRHRTCFPNPGGHVHLTRTFSISTGSNQSANDSSSRRIKPTPASRPQVVDARSLGAPRADGQGTILRAPRLRLRTGPVARNRRTGSIGGAGNTKARVATKKPRTARNRRQSGEEEGEDARAIELEVALNERKLMEKLTPVRYNPVQYDASKLQETWPSLPIGTTAQAGSVLERMNLMSRRYANGFVSPVELAGRLFEGESVLFRNEEEKKLAMEEVKKLAQQRADGLTRRKGELVELEDTSFLPIGNSERKALVGQLVKGTYTHRKQEQPSHPALGEVGRQLFNNETYRIAGKQSEFMRKLQSLVTPVKAAGSR